MNFKVTAIVTSIDEGESPDGKHPELVRVESHWNRDQLVVLQVADLRVTVSALDLLEAVRRCSR